MFILKKTKNKLVGDLRTLQLPTHDTDEWTKIARAAKDDYPGIGQVEDLFVRHIPGVLQKTVDAHGDPAKMGLVIEELRENVERVGVLFFMGGASYGVQHIVDDAIHNNDILKDLGLRLTRNGWLAFITMAGIAAWGWLR